MTSSSFSSFFDRRVWAAFVPAALLLIACTSSGSGSTATGEPVPADQIGQKYVEKICPAIATCCSQNGFAEEHKRCANGAAAIQAEFDKDRNRTAGAVYDAQRAGNCIAKYAAAYATCNPKFDDDADDDCKAILTGTKQAGAECNRDSECAAGLECTGTTSTTTSDGQTTTVPGKCVRMKAPAAGDPCLAYDPENKVDATKTYGDCQYSSKQFYCDGASKTCKPRGGPGTDCFTQTSGNVSMSNSSACNETAYCDSTTKKCEARKGAGEACSDTVGNDACAEGHYCDRETKKCEKKKAGGESCNAETGFGECLHGCDRTSGKCQNNDVDRDLCAGED